jgi:hypothetical protein
MIGYFYIVPTIDEIGMIQTDTATYKEERVKIESINNQLAEDLATFESISRADKERLATYMPGVVDDISVMRDISFIVEQADVTSTALSYDGLQEAKRSILSQTGGTVSALGDNAATAHSFALDIQGTYEDTKTFLRLLEQNEYPLEVHELNITTDENGLINASMKLITYVDTLVLVSGN